MAQFQASDLVPFLFEPERRVHRPEQPRETPPDAPPTDDPKRLLRSPTNPRDLSLSPLARTWCERFQVVDRPLALCERYPRIANRIALCWDDKKLTELLFKDLLADRRGGRRGFPLPVREDLLRLRDLAGLGPEAPPRLPANSPYRRF